MQFPPNIIAEKVIKISHLMAEIEAKDLYEKMRPTASVYPFHDLFSSFHHQVPCYFSHDHVPPAPPKPLSGPSLIHVPISKPTSRPTSPHNGGKPGGRRMLARNLTLTLPLC
jgi:hypothetical protein